MSAPIIDTLNGRYTFLPQSPQPVRQTPCLTEKQKNCAQILTGIILYTGGIVSIGTLYYYVYIEPNLHC